MNILMRVALSLVFFFISACGGGSSPAAPAQTTAAIWQKSVITGGDIVALAISPDNGQTVYATGSDNISTPSNMLKSTNGGVSWGEVDGGLTLYTEITSIAIDPSNSKTIYAWVGCGGVYKSTDGGISWTAMNDGISDADVSNAQGILIVDPTNSLIVYAGTMNNIMGTLGGGVYKSTDGGGSWNAVNSGLPSMSISSLAIAPSNSQTIYAGTSYSFGGVYKSTDGGGSWSAVNNGLATTGSRPNSMFVSSLAIDPSNSQTIYAGTIGGVYKSTNGGTSWIATNNSLSWIVGGVTRSTVMSLAIDPTNSQAIYAGTNGGGVFQSTNGGETWTVVNGGLSNTQVLSLVIDPNNSQTVYAGTGIGVFKGLFPI